MESVVILRDGKVVDLTDNELRWFNRHTPMSSDWAKKHEGYSVLYIAPGPTDDLYDVADESGTRVGTVQECGSTLALAGNEGQQVYGARGEDSRSLGYGFTLRQAVEAILTGNAEGK